MSDREQTTCPKCGHDIAIVGEHPIGEQTHYHVECPECGISGPECETFNDAVTAWEYIFPLIEKINAVEFALDSRAGSRLVWIGHNKDAGAAVRHILNSFDEAWEIINELKKRQPWQHCDRHSDADTNPQTSWACPECMREMRSAIRRIVGARHNTGALSDEIDKADQLTRREDGEE